MVKRLALLVALAWCAPADASQGMASYYSTPQRTASGQRFNPNAFTCAHRSLPFGTRVKVARGARSVVVVVNDRGPFVRGRVLDLSRGAAAALGMLASGVARVTWEIER